jgi:hypothetical protein
VDQSSRLLLVGQWRFCDRVVAYVDISINASMTFLSTVLILVAQSVRNLQ